MNDVVKIRRTNGGYHVDTIKFINQKKIYVVFHNELNQVCLKGPLRPNEVTILEHQTIVKTVQRKLCLLRCRHIFLFFLFILITLCLTTGIIHNYKLIERKNEYDSSGLINFLNPRFFEPASIWKASLMTLSDIPRAVSKLIGYVVSDFSNAVLSQCGHLEKFIGTIALLFFAFKVLAKYFLF